jgi:hypothetical protein
VNALKSDSAQVRTPVIRNLLTTPRVTSLITLKDKSVNVQALSAEMYFAVGVIEAVFAKYGLDVVITSAADSTHNPGSLHSQGKALDIRWELGDSATGEVIFIELVRRLERRGFDVVDERKRASKAWTGAHLHIEHQPKQGECFWR